MYLIISGEINHLRGRFEIVYCQLSKTKPVNGDDVWVIDDRYITARTIKTYIIIKYHSYSGKIKHIEIKWGNYNISNYSDTEVIVYDLHELLDEFEQL